MTAPIEIERTALIVVDMQNAFCDPEGSCARLGFDISMCQAAVTPCVRLAEAARAQGDSGHPDPSDLPRGLPGWRRAHRTT